MQRLSRSSRCLTRTFGRTLTVTSCCSSSATMIDERSSRACSLSMVVLVSCPAPGVTRRWIMVERRHVSVLRGTAEAGGGCSRWGRPCCFEVARFKELARRFEGCTRCGSVSTTASSLSAHTRAWASSRQRVRLGRGTCRLQGPSGFGCRQLVHRCRRRRRHRCQLVHLCRVHLRRHRSCHAVSRVHPRPCIQSHAMRGGKRHAILIRRGRGTQQSSRPSRTRRRRHKTLQLAGTSLGSLGLKNQIVRRAYLKCHVTSLGRSACAGVRIIHWRWQSLAQRQRLSRSHHQSPSTPRMMASTTSRRRMPLCKARRRGGWCQGSLCLVKGGCWRRRRRGGCRR